METYIYKITKIGDTLVLYHLSIYCTIIHITMLLTLSQLTEP